VILFLLQAEYDIVVARTVQSGTSSVVVANRMVCNHIKCCG